MIDFGENLYLFISSKKGELLNKSKSTGLLSVYEVVNKDDESTSLFLSKRKIDVPFFISVINDQSDYDLEEYRHNPGNCLNPVITHDSLVSFSIFEKNRFVAKTDYWSIQNHYYYRDSDTFACSNNVFLLARLVDAKFSKESIYEYLFFGAPVRERTWFRDIFCLLPGQALTYNLETSSFTLSGKIDFYDALVHPDSALQQPLVDSFQQFFENALKVLGNKSALLSLSSGSDSRTVLSGLLKYDLLKKAVSFGRSDFVETKRIKTLADTCGFPAEVFEFDKTLMNWDRKFIDASIHTNGLLNPFRVHYAGYYELLPKSMALFEGFFGSEFVKAEVASNAMISLCHEEVIGKGLSIDEGIAKVYHELPSEFRGEMSQFIKGQYGNELQPLKDEEGRKKYAVFAFEFMPSRIFGPMILLAGLRFKNYYPFLSPRLLRSAFEVSGITKWTSLDPSYPGPIKSIIAEAMIVKAMSPQLFNSVLDRGVSFKEALSSPHAVSKIAKKMRVGHGRLANPGKNWGQVDDSQLAVPVADFVERHRSLAMPEEFGSVLRSHNLLKQKAALLALQQIMNIAD